VCGSYGVVRSASMEIGGGVGGGTAERGTGEVVGRVRCVDETAWRSCRVDALRTDALLERS